MAPAFRMALRIARPAALAAAAIATVHRCRDRCGYSLNKLARTRRVPSGTAYTIHDSQGADDLHINGGNDASVIAAKRTRNVRQARRLGAGNQLGSARLSREL